MISSNKQHGPNTKNRQLSISTSLSKELIDLRIENPLNVILFYIKINSIRHNCSDLQQVIFTTQFHFANYHTTYCLGISDKCESIFAYIKPNIPIRQLNCGNVCTSIQVVPFEINLRKELWLGITIYQPPPQNSELFP